MDFHYPVMLQEVKKFVGKQIEKNNLEGRGGIVLFDGTLGHAGHLIDLLNYYSDNIIEYIATDADNSMFDVSIERVILNFVNKGNGINKEVKNSTIGKRVDLFEKIVLYNCSYVKLGDIAHELNVNYDVVFLDLGVNLWHFKQHERGFSIKGEGVLDMRYNTNTIELKNTEDNNNETITAANVLNNYSEQQLIEMFVLNSDISLPTSAKLAGEIVRMRKDKPRKMSTELNKLTMKLNYSARVAAIVFQALRIEVNQEFQNIKSCIQICSKVMKPDGILMVLSYHSGEDRIVKEMMKSMKENGLGEIVTKNAIPPTYQETQKNKPSRSARLRVFRFIGKQEL